MADSATPNAGERRPIKARETGWARALALRLAALRVTPNFISLASIVMAIVALGGFMLAAFCPQLACQVSGLVVAIVGMQGRLMCNLLDGMVAVEGGVGGGKLGEIFNDLPDRIADPIILLAAGLLADPRYGMHLAVAATIGSLLTAYVRVLGRSIGARAHFVGPMAKQHRMAVLTIACAVSIAAIRSDWRPVIFSAALALIAAGCAITVIRRLIRIRLDLVERT